MGAAEVSAALLADLLGRWPSRWRAAFITGLAPDSARERAVIDMLGTRYRLAEGAVMVRQVADLSGGIEAYLARRPRTFRRNLRQAQTRADGADLGYDIVSGGGPEVVERAREVERRSWKGADASGLLGGDMFAFYRRMAERLAGSGRLRSCFARIGGEDVGYILGAVRGGAYRGLQISYDQRWASLSIGNLLQLRQMQALEAEGIGRYDLGMDLAYKRLWADGEFTTRTVVAVRP